MKYFLLLPGILAVLLPGSAFSAMITLPGDTTSGSTYNRTTETGAQSILGSSVHYNAYQVTVNASGSYIFTLSAVDPTSYDTFIHLYQGSFDPANSSVNLVAANDDFGSGTDSQITQSLTAGSPYFLVVDGSSSSDFGAYNATISGPGAITASPVAVPEPSSFLTLSSGAGLLAILRRRRRA